MKKNKKLIIILIQIFTMFVFVLSYKAYNDNNVKPVYVIGFVRNIEAGVKITIKDLEKVPISQMTYSQQMLLANQQNEIVGKYTTTKVYKGNISYRNQLGDINVVDNFANMDLSNKILVSIPLTLAEGIAGDLAAGDRIDVSFTGSGSSKNAITQDDEEFTYSKIFLRDIPVYQVNTTDGYKYIPRANVIPGEKYSDSETQEFTGELGSITVVLTPEQLEEFETRKALGSIRIAKRFKETENHETLGFVIGNYGKIFSGNANAETGRLQITEDFTEEPVQVIPSDNTTDQNEQP